MKKPEPVKPCLVAFALREELEPFASSTPFYDEINEQRVLNPFEVNHKFRSADTLVAVAGPSGVGRGPARRWANEQLEVLDTEFILAAGLAGGLVDGLANKSLVLATECVKEGGGDPIPVDPRWLEAAASLVPEARQGRIVTVDQPLMTVEAKRRAAERFGAIAVDMETYSFAEVAQERHRPFLALRVISDDVTESLPPEVQGFVGADTAGKRFKVALRTLMVPLRLGRLLKLRKTVRESALKLGGSAWTLIEGLRAKAIELRADSE